jgi:hypothetical protein
MNVATQNIDVVSDYNNLGCAGVPVTFTAVTATNTPPVYQWKKNGVDVGANVSTYVDNTLVTGDAITCTMTNLAYCPSPSKPVSTPIVMTINQPVTPVLTVTVPSTSICSGTQVLFSTTNINGGLVPKYQWTLNGLDVAGATNATYANGALNNGDQVACKLQSSLTCAVPVVSNNVDMTVIDNKPHTVDIIGIPGPDGILFHSSVENGGVTTYQWRLNNKDIAGATQSTYLATSLKSNESISVSTRSTLACAVPEVALSKVLFGSQVTGIEPGDKTLDELTLYPNPNNGVFTLKGKLYAANSNENITVTIVNAIGQTVYTNTLTLKNNDMDATVDLGNKNAAGTYMIHVNVDGKVHSARFVVK